MTLLSVNKKTAKVIIRLSSWNLNIKVVIVMCQPKHDDANIQQPIMFALLLIKQNFFANQLK